MATVTKDFRVKAGLVVEGSTATVNSHDILTEALVDAKGDLLVASGADAVTRLAVGTNGYVLTANTSATNGIEWAAPAAVGEFASSITFEGSSADDNETTLQVTNPTADRTITLPDATGQVVLRDTTDTLTNKSIALSGNTVTGSIADFNTALTDADFATLSGTETLANKTLTSPTVSGLYLSDSSIVFEGSSADDNETTLQVTNPTADRTITIPDVTGTIITSGDSATVTNAMLAGSIANDKLSNSAITINGTSTSLGGSRTLGSDDIAEGSTNKYFTDERAQDAIGTVVGNGLDYDDDTGAISVDPSEFKLNDVGAPNASVSLNSQKITGLATPTDATDAANKGYVDNAVVGIDWKASVRAATTTNVTIASDLENGDTLDGVTLATGDRILVKNQSTGSQNGIYVVKASGAPDRSTDADTGAELTSNFAVFVEEGTANADQGYVLTNDGAITVGTTALTFTQFTGLGQVTAGDGLTKTGNTLNVGAGTGIQVNSDTIENTGVLSITGTANQITASASTGAITLSGPQDLHSAATPTFAGVNAGSGNVTAGSITLTDALLGTAAATASTSATTIDSWSATTYSSAKYIVQMKNGSNIEVIELLVTVDGSNNVYLTEYADVISNTELGTTNAVYSGGNVLLQVTGAAADTVVKVNKVYIEA
jgi:hypothetical protein